MTSPPTAAQRALTERDKLIRNYRRAKDAEFRELCADRQYGLRLQIFSRELDQFGPEDADVMIAAVRSAQYWLRQAPQPIGRAAMQLVTQRVIKIREKAGLLPFDDPFPGEDDDVWRVCRRIFEGAEA